MMFLDNEASDFDGDQQRQALDDRRNGDDTRLLTTLLIGRLVTARGDMVCRVRNISGNGARIECAIALSRGDRIKLELRGADPFDAEVAWAQAGAAGLRFLSPVPSALILKPPAKQRGWHTRLPRLDAECAVLLTVAGRRAAATLHDINQRGMRVDGLTIELPMGTISVHIPGLGTLSAGLRWQRDGAAGLQLVTPIRFETLSAWLADPRHLNRPQ